MSQLNKILMIAAFLFAIQPLFAATVVVDQPAATSVQEGKVDGEKTTFRERLATKILDKKIKKAMKEDKAYKEGSGGNILSLLALIFGEPPFSLSGLLAWSVSFLPLRVSFLG